mmetsp:Transcript_10612/g.14314  ORF Transcript_10612/g.14314 Transcript_10612/m.14314 type:complete len:345 (-) Transcript_10612:525-1559(-)
MFKAEDVFSRCCAIHVNLDTEDLIVTHTHEVPGWIRRLGIAGLVPGANPDLLAANKVGNTDLVAPPEPAPVHAIVGWLLLAIKSGKFPVSTTIESNFNTGDRTSTSGIGVTRDFIVFVDILCDAQCFVVVRLGDSRVDVELVENVLRLVPPAAREGLLCGDVGRQNTIVVVMIVILGLVFNDVDFCKPLDHSASNVTRNDETDRISMIGLEDFTISFIGNKDVVGRVHGASKRNGSTVFDKLAPLLVREGTGTNLVGKILNTNKLDMFATHVLLRDSGLEEEIAKHDTLPDVGGNTAGTPIEANCLTDHVLLLAAISSANKSHGQLTRLHSNELVHADLKRIRC